MNRQALIVGINQYQHSDLNSLSLPADDAEAIAQMLEKHSDFKVTRLPAVADEQQNKPAVGKTILIDSACLEDALIQLFKPDSRQAPDSALFYFAGHGIRKQKGLDEGYLATSDCNFHNVWGLSLKWLRELLCESSVKQQIVWLDCCHSGALLNFDQGIILVKMVKVGIVVLLLLQGILNLLMRKSQGIMGF